MSEIIDIHKNQSLAARFWSIARAMESNALSSDPVVAVKHVLAVLDALGRGETGEGLSVNTLSFLKLLRESEPFEVVDVTSDDTDDADRYTQSPTTWQTAHTYDYVGNVTSTT
ncbi:MAG: hypothetical protein GY767_06340, partial [Shimia sp.]|nr:hypothetical protein [Shimia sp.]